VRHETGAHQRAYAGKDLEFQDLSGGYILPKTQRQKLYRQGDVMFELIAAIPSGESRKRKNGTVAYGEVTGHSHHLADLESAEVLEIEDGLYVRVSESGVSIDGDAGATFVHEEHGPISLPPGDYRVKIQREYSPEEIRSVVD